MKRNGIIGFSVITLLISSCNFKKNSDNIQSSPDTTNTPLNQTNDVNIQPNDSSLIVQFNQFYRALVTKDNKTINQFIIPEIGFTIIYSEGAMPQVTNTNDIINFTTGSDKSLYEIVQFPSINLTFGDLPKITCEGTKIYEREGAFISNKQNIFLEQRLWEYADFNESEKKLFTQWAKQITHTVLITGNGYYGIQFIEGKLKVLFMDFRIPCSA
jgi:hypothetical protein